MTRKSPIEHPVKGHIRSGKLIKKFKRGSGKNPEPVKRVTKAPRRVGKPVKGATFKVTMIGKGGTEAYPVKAGTLTGAIREAIRKLQRPIIPDTIRWVRL